MKSAEARLQATGMFHTTEIGRSASSSGMENWVEILW